jgi:putative ABC transport system permease protein
MVLYYITLMASLSFRRRETEIVVLLSRGAGRGQVVVSFLLEWLLVGGAAFAVSPLVGAVAARAIGASTGFLSFVDRQAVSISLMPQAWWFALAAAATGLLAGMAPTFSTFKYSIVTFKQQRGRRRGSRPLWSRIYLDVILLAIAAFGYRDLTLQSRAIDADAILSNDPVFFLVPFVGIFGAGLFCLRLFPTIIGLLHWVSIRFRGVVLQMTFRELYRNARHYAPLILLIILTVASGMYSASAARTLGENFEDQIYYRVGADLVVNEMWGQPEGAAPVSSSQLASSRAEPPFYRRLELPGVSSAARVFRARVGVHTEATRIGQADLMAVVPREFAQTAWYRQDLAPSHFYNYLKLLRRHPEGVLVSEAAAANSQLELGDVLTVSYSGQQLDVYVVGTVPYWPSLFPGEGRFLVANLAHIQNYALLEPYEVWYDLAPDAEVQLLIDEAVALGVYATDYTYARGEVRDLRREPYRMGFFGILSMGFIVSGLVTTLGIFAYSLFSMHNRRVQFGSLRALGLSARQLVSVLGLEHLTSFATGLVAGVAVGLGAVRLFLPFLRDRAEELQAVPPFLIVTESADLNRILIVLAVVFVVTVGGLAAILRRIRLGEAIRLGEEL